MKASVIVGIGPLVVLLKNPMRTSGFEFTGLAFVFVF
jgi:hypothetical protein